MNKPGRPTTDSERLAMSFPKDVAGFLKTLGRKRSAYVTELVRKDQKKKK